MEYYAIQFLLSSIFPKLAQVVSVAIGRSYAMTLKVTISDILAQTLVLQAPPFRWLTGKDISGPLFSPFFLPISVKLEYYHYQIWYSFESAYKILSFSDIIRVQMYFNEKFGLYFQKLSFPKCQLSEKRYKTHFFLE